MKRNKIRLWVFGMLTLAVMVMIFFMSAKEASKSDSMSRWLLYTPFGQMLMKLLPRLTEKGAEHDIRKYAHMAEYTMLAIPSTLFFRELLLERFPPLRSMGCGLVFCVLYACTDEYHQTFVPGRAGAPIDVLVDLVGICFGLLLVFLLCIPRKELK